MPELPEVEVVRRGCHDWVVGRTISDVQVLHPRPVRRQIGGAVEFADRLAGTTIRSAVRRGKFLWWQTDDDCALMIHLGMSGQVLVHEADDAPHRHLRVRIGFTDSGPQAWFVDQRMFGGMTVTDLVPTTDGGPGGVCGPREAVVSGEPVIPDIAAHIARDPLDPVFDDEALYRALIKKKTGIKRALLDQSLISGVGNIYADEALWRAQVHYAKPASLMTSQVTSTLVDALRDVMKSALAQGGTSFDSLYVNVNGESGYFDRSLEVYGQEGQPCSRCAGQIVREKFMNRSSFRCPQCQPAPRQRRKETV